MKRIEFEEKSRNIIDKYVAMLDCMNAGRVTDVISDDYTVNSYAYFKITELSKLWYPEERPLWNILSEVFISLHSHNISVSTVFNSDGHKTDVFIGGPIQFLDVIKNTYAGVLSQVQFAENEYGNEKIFNSSSVLDNQIWSDGGFLKGNPTGSENFVFSNQIEKVIRGMQNKKWQISVFAKPIAKSESVAKQHMWLTIATECSQLSDVTYTDSDNVETTAYKKSYYHSDQYNKKIQAFVEKLDESIAVGEWNTVINFATTSDENARLLGGLLSSSYFGEKSLPEPVHSVYHSHNSYHRLINADSFTHGFFCDYNYPVYGTFLSSKELAVYSAPPVIDTAGFSVRDYVEFDVNRADGGDLTIGQILESGKVSNNTYNLNTNELNRHALVVGLTGSGKTNTVKSLICELTKGKGRPFMVIEPAKKEYWELYKLGYDDLQVYSVGSNEPNCHIMCLNPFERSFYTDEHGNRKSVPIQTHIDFVYSAFKASFIMYTPMPYVLERAIYEIYEDCGWDIHNNLNKTGKEVYPTIEDLYFKIPDVVTDMGYDQKMRNDLIGSLQARINSMRLGSKGDTLNVRHSFPLDRLLNGNVVIELEDIGDDDVKAFIISLLLINLLEYRRQQADSQLYVNHLMLIEEAHRLLKNVQSGTGENADPRGAAVEFFCNLLAELRSKGQGFIVADQIPSKLAPDLIKNTNLKITHRTVAAEERELIGGAMHMTEEQIDSLASLRQGVAAVYSEGDNRPKLVKPKFAGDYSVEERKNISRDDCLSAISKNCISVDGNAGYISQTNLKNAICRKCNSSCEKNPQEILSRIDDISEYKRFSACLNPVRIKTCKLKEIVAKTETFAKKHLVQTSDFAEQDVNCLMNCLLSDWELSDDFRDKIIRVYNKKDRR